MPLAGKRTVLAAGALLLALALAATWAQAGPQSGGGSEPPSPEGASPSSAPEVNLDLPSPPPIRTETDLPLSQLSPCHVQLPPEPQPGWNQIATDGPCDAGTVALLVGWITGWSVTGIEPAAGTGSWMVEISDPSKPHAPVNLEAKYAEPPLLRPGAGQPPRPLTIEATDHGGYGRGEAIALALYLQNVSANTWDIDNFPGTLNLFKADTGEMVRSIAVEKEFRRLAPGEEAPIKVGIPGELTQTLDPGRYGIRVEFRLAGGTTLTISAGQVFTILPAGNP